MSLIPSTYCWDASNANPSIHNLTSSYNYATQSGIRQVQFCGCWENCSGTATFGLGKYQVRITPDDERYVQFTIDYRTSTIPQNFGSADINLYYTYPDNTLKYSNGNNFPSNTTIWNEFDWVGYSPLLAQIASYGTPHLVWDNQPVGSRTGYIVYRGLNSNSLTAICTTANNIYSYYDYDYSIIGHGNRAHYKVSALFFDGATYRESDQSNDVSVLVVAANKKKGEDNHSENYYSTNYPNPFNPTTKIYFSLSESSNLQIVVFNSYGQEIQQLFKGIKEKGNHELLFDGKNLPSGVYYYTIKTDKLSETKKMILLK